MEYTSDKQKSAPVLLLGEPLEFLANVPHVAEIASLGELSPNTYFLLNLKSETLRETIDTLVFRGGCRDQIIVCASGDSAAHFTFDPLIGIFEIPEIDTAEEARLRLQARIETQRHRKLSAEIELARQSGLPSDLSAEEWRLRMETAHLTHAFCASLNLCASRHGEGLRAALSGAAENAPTWDSSWPFERLLALCARLAVLHSQTPSAFREDLRRLSANLPFRIRTELRDVSERCLESIWKGIANVA